MQTSETKTNNIWRSIWFKPRKTITHIITASPDYMMWILASLGAVSYMLNEAYSGDYGDNYSVATIISFVLLTSPIIGITTLYILGYYLQITGRWSGGKASQNHLRKAIAWSNVPLAFACLLWILEFGLAGQELFQSAKPILASQPIPSKIFDGLLIINIILGFWSFIMLLEFIGKVQNLTTWKTFEYLFFSWIIFMALMLMLLLIYEHVL